MIPHHFLAGTLNHPTRQRLVNQMRTVHSLPIPFFQMDNTTMKHYVDSFVGGEGRGTVVRPGGGFVYSEH